MHRRTLRDLARTMAIGMASKDAELRVIDSETLMGVSLEAPVMDQGVLATTELWDVATALRELVRKGDGEGVTMQVILQAFSLVELEKEWRDLHGYQQELWADLAWAVLNAAKVTVGAKFLVGTYNPALHDEEWDREVLDEVPAFHAPDHYGCHDWSDAEQELELELGDTYLLAVIGRPEELAVFGGGAPVDDSEGASEPSDDPPMPERRA